MIEVVRNLQSKIEHMMQVFPAVAIIGARQTGKTVLAQQICPDWKYMDLEQMGDLEQISRDPKLFFQQFAENILFDEAQNYPELFNVLRGVIDADRDKKGRFILTGSSSPELLESISESLSGRIGIVELGTLKANEYFQLPLSPFYDIFQQKLDKRFLNFEKQPISNQQMCDVWLKGGYPEPVLKLDESVYSLWMENYKDTYINRDIAKLFPRLNKVKYQRFIAMLAKLSGNIINKSSIGRALEFNESVARDYLKIADQTFIWRELLSYEKSVTKSIVKMPKGHFRDSGLMHYLLRITDHESLYADPCVGRSFEGFVIEEILKGLSATLITNWDAYYYRTRGGAEIDLLLEGAFGLLPIEIKYGASVQTKQLTSLSHFISSNNLKFGFLINQGSEVMWLTDNILQVPVGWI